MRKLFVGLAAFLVTVALGLGIVAATQDKKPKHTIKQVMGEAHKSKLVNKVQEGKASQEEKEKLLSMYISLYENKPPMGEVASWQQKTADLVVAGAKVVLGAEDGSESLKAAANCAACHTAHKPK
jgi:hypothetical protein